MANSIDLTKDPISPAIKIDDITTRRRIPENHSAYQYLHEIELGDRAAIRACTLVDVPPKSQGNTDRSTTVLSNGIYKNYKLALLTLPIGIQYVNFELKGNTLIFNQQDIGEDLKEPIHTPILVNVFSTNQNHPFHFCVNEYEGFEELKKPMTNYPFACYEPLSSLRDTDEKPFHLFYIKNIDLFSGFGENHSFQETEDCYFMIPVLMSEGTIPFYIIKEDKVNNSHLDELNKWATEVNNVRKSKKWGAHWTSRTPLNYHDHLHIFVCTNLEVAPKKP
jgi:hypothetical protein